MEFLTFIKPLVSFSPIKLKVYSLPPVDPQPPFAVGSCCVMLNDAEIPAAFSQVQPSSPQRVKGNTLRKFTSFTPFEEVALIKDDKKIFTSNFLNPDIPKISDGTLELVITKRLHKEPFSTSSDESAWGRVKANGDSTSPPEFVAKAKPNGDYYKIGNVKFKLPIDFDIVDENSPAWDDSGKQPQQQIPEFSKIVGQWGGRANARLCRGNIPVRERKYWAFMHEIDHLRCWIDYWNLMKKYIVTAIEHNFPTETACLDYIKKIRYNNHINWQAAKKRSSFFDCIPPSAPITGTQNGKTYNITSITPGGLYPHYRNGLIGRFPSDMEFVWLPISKIKDHTHSKGSAGKTCKDCAIQCELVYEPPLIDRSK